MTVLKKRKKKVLFVFENGTQLFFELATTLKNLEAKWLSEKKVNFTPCIIHTLYSKQVVRILKLIRYNLLP